MTFSSVVDSLTALMEDDIFNFPHWSTSGEKLIYDTLTHVQVSSHPSLSSAHASLSGKCIIGQSTTTPASFPIKANQSCDQLCNEVEFLCKWASLRNKYEGIWSPGWKSNEAKCVQQNKELSSNVAHTQKYTQSSSPIPRDQIERNLEGQVREKVQKPVRMLRPLTRLEEIVASTLQKLVVVARKRNPLASLEEVERECMSFLLKGCKGPSPYENVTNGARQLDAGLVSSTSRLGSSAESRGSKAQVHQQHRSQIPRNNDTVRDVVKPFNANTLLPKESESTEEAKENAMLAKLREECLASLPRRSEVMQSRKQDPHVHMNAPHLISFPKSTESKAEEKQRPLVFHVREKYSATSTSGALASSLASTPMGESKGRLNRKRPAPSELPAEEKNHKKKFHFIKNNLNL